MSNNNNNCCGDSIYNKQKSIIPTPNCASECPSDIGCTDIIPATCVSILNDYCLDLGESLEDALTNLSNAICNIVPPSGYSSTVAIDAFDTCPGYLYDKITSSCFNITKSSSGTACKTLNIDPKYLTWKNITLDTGWSSKQGFQAPQYALDCNGKVWFRGVAWYSGMTLDPSPLDGPFNLSTQIDNISPLIKRICPSLSFEISYGGNLDNETYLPAKMLINANGTTKIACAYYGLSAPVVGAMYVYLDGFSIELN